MRDLSVNEQRSVAGGMALSNEFSSWVPSSVLLALRAGDLNIGLGEISLPVRSLGFNPGPLIVPSPIFYDGPVGLPYDC